MTEIISKNLHYPVMVKEAVEWLNLKNSLIVVDGTLGLGGYSEAIFEVASDKLKIIAFDLDEQNLNLAKEKLKKFSNRILYYNRNFSELTEVLNELQYSKIDGIVLDLGIASTQVDRAEKGFAFSKNGPLDMRFSKKQKLTAAEIVNQYGEKELAQIFYKYGEEKRSRKIASLIVTERIKKSFETTKDLADLILVKLGKLGRIHPATKIFQALRIEVNKELDNLVSVLNQSITFLKSGGRIIVISYHSLEDRIVKNFFRDASREFINLKEELMTRKLDPSLKILTKKPIKPSSAEIAANPRARSALLRVAERV